MENPALYLVVNKFQRLSRHLTGKQLPLLLNPGMISCNFPNIIKAEPVPVHKIEDRFKINVEVREVLMLEWRPKQSREFGKYLLVSSFNYGFLVFEMIGQVAHTYPCVICNLLKACVCYSVLEEKFFSNF